MAWNEYGRLTRVALRHPRDAFGSQAAIAASWRDLGYLGEPDLGKAIAEYDRFAELIASPGGNGGAEILWLGAEAGLTLDALYVRDAGIGTPRGLLMTAMGKPARSGEPAALGRALEAAGLPLAGAIEGEGRLEGGDFSWLRDDLAVVGQGYRTNDEGIRQLGACLGEGVELRVARLPHYKGPQDVFHLMSIISPLDRDLALVFSPLMPVDFRQALLASGLTLVEVPEEEFDSMGCNVLALAPRRCLALDGNPETRKRLEKAGCEVLTYGGQEISAKGSGGPTCLTQPLARA
jgi:N-dimethylarginine dimethylaminohydrolase